MKDGTIYGGKKTSNLVNEWCESLHVTYGTVIDARDDIIIGDGIKNTIRYATIEMDGMQFEVTLDDAIIDDIVIVFFSKDNKRQMVYRFAIRKAE